MAVIETERGLEINIKNEGKIQSKRAENPDVNLITAAACSRLIGVRDLGAEDGDIGQVMDNLIDILANEKGAVDALKKLQR